MSQTQQDTYSIYALGHPSEKTLHYVGMTTNPTKRYKQHLRASSSRSLSQWIQQLATQGLKPIMLLFEENIPDEQTAREREKYWIAFFAKNNHPLENFSHNEEYLRKRAEEQAFAEQEARALARLTPEEQVKLSALNEEGTRLYGRGYSQVFWDMWRTAYGPYQIDADKHRVALAEIALKFCAILTHQEEGTS
jgi:predicted GIY-YIG superfamily endonuclease